MKQSLRPVQSFHHQNHMVQMMA